MSDVVFQEEQNKSQSEEVTRTPKGIVKMVITMKLAKTEDEANKVLLMVAGGAILIAIIYPLIFS